MSCPPVVPVSDNLFENLKQEQGILSQLNINRCQQSSSKYSSSYSTSGSTALFFQKSSGAGSESSSSESSVGCGPLNILMQNHMNAVNNVHCILQEQDQSISTNISTINTIEYDGNFTFNCPTGFNIIQGNDVQMKIITHIGSTAQAKIKTAVNNAIQNFTNDLKNLPGGETAYGPNGEGTTQINSINDESVQADTNDAITTCIQNLSNIYITGNTLKLGNTGSNIIVNSGAGCNITQDSHVSLIANNIVDTAFTVALSNVNLNKLLPPLPPQPSSSGSSIYLIIGIVVVVILILGVVGYFYFKNKSKLPTKAPYKFRF